MKRTVLTYSLAIALLAASLQWLEHRYAVQVLSTRYFVGVVALGFLALGVWVGARLTVPRSSGDSFELNRSAVEYLRLSDRELEVLGLIARGLSNKEIAKALIVSPNTVKTHLANLYAKLEVSRRTQAVQRARELGILR